MRTWPLAPHIRLPDSLRRTGPSAWGKRNRGDDSLHSWLEGPAIDGNGDLWFVDVAYGRIFRSVDGREVEVVLEYDGAPNGLAFDEGSLVVADGQRGLIWLDVGSSAAVVSRELERWGEEPFLGLNDLVVGAGRAVLATDQGMTGLHDPSGRILYLSPSRSAVLLSGIPSPNGIALRPNSRELLVAVTRDNAIWRVPFDEELMPYRVGRYIQMSGGIGPDGISFGEEGELFVAHLGLGVVWRYDALGRPIGGFEVPNGLNPTNVIYSPEERVIYVTEADTAEVLVGEVKTF